MEPGPGYDGVSYSLSILCLTYSVALGFSSREAASAWEARIRYSLGEGEGPGGPVGLGAPGGRRAGGSGGPVEDRVPVVEDRVLVVEDRVLVVEDHRRTWILWIFRLSEI